MPWWNQCFIKLMHTNKKIEKMYQKQKQKAWPLRTIGPPYLVLSTAADLGLLGPLQSCVRSTQTARGGGWILAHLCLHICSLIPPDLGDASSQTKLLRILVRWQKGSMPSLRPLWVGDPMWPPYLWNQPCLLPVAPSTYLGLCPVLLELKTDKAGTHTTTLLLDDPKKAYCMLSGK
jgi:hypothetical protein